MSRAEKGGYAGILEQKVRGFGSERLGLGDPGFGDFGFGDFGFGDFGFGDFGFGDFGFGGLWG
jgi:hypothetical protein